MSEQSIYYKRLAAALEAGTPLWQASVVFTDGSTPARLGMKLSVPLTGDCFGNLGGGEMEYLVIQAIRSRQPETILKLTYNLDEQGRPSQFVGSDANPTKEVQTRMICGGRVEVLVEPLHSPYPLYIIGGGHCGRALAEFAVKTDFSVTVIDNRPELLSEQAFPPEVRLLHNDYTNLETVLTFSPQAFIVIMTHGHVHDRQVLESCLSRPFRYLGMIGSKKKVAETLERNEVRVVASARAAQAVVIGGADRRDKILALKLPVGILEAHVNNIRVVEKDAIDGP